MVRAAKNLALKNLSSQEILSPLDLLVAIFFCRQTHIV
nr:MAG TPA: hypothetical protein [Caudoviricetes sp.]